MKQSIEFMNNNGVFAAFSNLEKQAVFEFLKPLSLQKDEILFRQGDKGTNLYLVNQGVIGGYILLQDNKQMEVGRFAAGQSCGEMAIIEAIPRTMTCYAVTAAELYILEAIDFYRFVWEHPVIGVKMLKGMTRNMSLWLSESNNFLNSLVRWGENARLRAITENLTGLFNNHYLEESIEFAIAKYQQTYKRFCYLMLDVDYFRQVNTSRGTSGGDELLKGIGQLLKSSLSENAVIAKLGGDEFAALFNDCPGPNALMRTRKFLETLKKNHTNLLVAGRPLETGITMSIGIAEYPTHGTNLAELKQSADRALYLAKKTGRDQAILVSARARVERSS